MPTEYLPIEKWAEYSELDRSVATMVAIKAILLILNDKDLLEREIVEGHQKAATKHAETLGGAGAAEAVTYIFERLHYWPSKTRDT